LIKSGTHLTTGLSTNKTNREKVFNRKNSSQVLSCASVPIWSVQNPFNTVFGSESCSVEFGLAEALPEPLPDALAEAEPLRQDLSLGFAPPRDTSICAARMRSERLFLGFPRGSSPGGGGTQGKDASADDPEKSVFGDTAWQQELRYSSN